MSILHAGEQLHHFQATIATCHRHSKLTFCSLSSSISITFTREQQDHSHQMTIKTCQRYSKLTFCSVSSSMSISSAGSNRGNPGTSTGTARRRLQRVELLQLTEPLRKNTAFIAPSCSTDLFLYVTLIIL